MKRLLAVFIALAVTASAWLSGCSASPAPVAPPHEPTPRPTGSPDKGDQGRGSDRGVATPTPSPAVNGQAPTPTCTAESTLPYEARRLVQMAKENLARRLDLSVSEISVISVVVVDWPDTSLGCPQPGMMYAQVITPGFRIVLEAKGQSYEYHTDEDRSVVLCQGDGSDVIPLMPVAPHGIPGKPMVPGE
jgi:hypothetical protein